jgi:hypothetical protein
VSATAKVVLSWNETNPGWTAATVVQKHEQQNNGVSVAESANRQAGSGFDPFPVIWHTLNACARDLDCHPGRIEVTILVESSEIEEIIRRQPLRG